MHEDHSETGQQDPGRTRSVLQRHATERRLKRDAAVNSAHRRNRKKQRRTIGDEAFETADW